ncbi:MAG TPA: ABC transporter ATP-binding protein [Bacteroidota bacterium]
MSFHCEKLSKTFHTRNGEVAALEDITFSANENEFICIVGPSGCGKSTFLRIVADILKPSSGRITLDSAKSSQRLRSALVFQEHGLFQWMTVLDNVAFGLEMQGVQKTIRRKKAREFIEQFGLAQFANNYPHELSIGMQQRVGIARAFLTDPEMLLMDEPFGSLDAQTKFVLREELLRIWREHQKLVLFVTHDIDEAILLGDRVLVMTGRPGRVREDIRITLERPRDPLAKDFSEVSEIKKKVWDMLEEEVRKNLWISH